MPTDQRQVKATKVSMSTDDMTGEWTVRLPEVDIEVTRGTQEEALEAFATALKEAALDPARAAKLEALSEAASSKDEGPAEVSSELERLPSVTMADFDQAVAGSTPVLVDFWAPWCGPCRSLAPSLIELQEQAGSRLRVMKVNVDEEPELAQRFGVRGIPRLLLFREGELLHGIVGARPLRELLDELAPFIG